jgi:hypothetical protein
VLRLLPPHLMALVAILILVLWVMLVNYFRRSPAIQRFVAETLGDNTPESSLRTFVVVKQRLADHLNDPHIDDQMRQKIELALGRQQDDVIDTPAGNVSR